MAIVVHEISSFSIVSHLGQAMLYLEGLVAVAHVGFMPSAYDLYDKAGQTAMVGSVCYVVSVITLLAVRGFVHA